MKIKAIPMRTVTYLGVDVQIPAHHTAVAADGCGQVYSYAGTPIEITTCWRSSNSYDSPYKVPARVDFTETVEWRNSLQLYPLAEANKVTAAAHPHAELMMKYAEIAQTTDKPWEHFEVRRNDSCAWEAIHLPVSFYSHMEYRLKPEPPKTIRLTKEAAVIHAKALLSLTKAAE